MPQKKGLVLDLHEATIDTDQQHVDIRKQRSQVSDQLEEQAVTFLRSPGSKAAVLSFD